MDAEQKLRRARQLAEAGNNEAARESLQEILKQDPDNLPALIMLGGSYYVSGMLGEAEMVFQRLVLLTPGAGKASIALFNTLWKMGRNEEALEEIRRFMRHADEIEEQEIIMQYQSITSAIAEGKS